MPENGSSGDMERHISPIGGEADRLIRELDGVLSPEDRAAVEEVLRQVNDAFVLDTIDNKRAQENVWRATLNRIRTKYKGRPRPKEVKE